MKAACKSFIFSSDLLEKILKEEHYQNLTHFLLKKKLPNVAFT